MFGEQSRTLVVENFVSVYDGAIIGCEVDSKVIRKFQLHKVEVELTTTSNVSKDEEEQEISNLAVPKKYSLYSCIIEDDEEVNVPRVVTMKGKRSEQAIAIDSRTDKMFKCKKVSTNKKIQNLKQIMKSFSRKIDKIHKQVKNIS